MYIAIDCTTPVKIALVNGVPTVASEYEGTISSEITHVIKEFSVLPAITATIPAVAFITNARSSPSLTLLSTPPFPPPLTVAPFFSLPVVVCFGRRPLLLYC